MYLILAIFLFIATGFAAIVESGKRANSVGLALSKADLKLKVIAPHRLNKTRDEKILSLYKSLTDTYLVLYKENPVLEERWTIVYRKKWLYDAPLDKWSSFDSCIGGSTNEFNRDKKTRHASVQIVEDILGYSVQGIPHDQFWKVVSDFEERFGYWSEVFARANHPVIIDSISKDSYHVDFLSPTVKMNKMLYDKDIRSYDCWKHIAEFFNDERELEIANAFKNNNEDFLKTLSELVGEDVVKSGMRETLLAVSRKEEWYAHTYINPAMFYHEYGLMLFGTNIKNYNKWRSEFGVPELTQEEFLNARNELKRLQNRYYLREHDRIKAAREKEELERVPFYPYKK